MKFNRTILLAATALIACSRIGVEEMPRPVVPEMGEDVVQGELLVRFDASVANILDKAGLTKSGPSNVLTSCAIPSVEEVLKIAGEYTIERVFPVDSRSEALSRSEGLHLWYRVKFDENVPLDKIYAELSRLGEISTVNCNRRLKKA